jgi:hypothetical protein
LKGFFITIAIFIALGFVALTQYDKVGQNLLDKTAVEEGSHDDVLAAATKDERAFVTKYQPLLERRWTIAMPALILDEAWFVTVSKATLDLYAETPLTTNKAYGDFAFERAKRIELSGNPALLNEAYALYKQNLKDFPNDEHAPLVRNAISRMITKYGMQ